MRVLCLVALLVLVAFQCTYWFGPSGYFATRQLDAELKHQQAFNLEVMRRNQELREEIRLLRTSPDRIEEIARTQLGMIAEGETFYLVVDSRRH